MLAALATSHVVSRHSLASGKHKEGGGKYFLSKHCHCALSLSLLRGGGLVFLCKAGLAGRAALSPAGRRQRWRWTTSAR
jgi:hypothetical protein